jgi:hypothetical protein
MDGPLLILADNYREASQWATEHGYPERERARDRDGREWLFIGPMSGKRLQGIRNGRYVDLRRDHRKLPYEALNVLKRAGFVEVSA